jgi:hypothetical protein
MASLNPQQQQKENSNQANSVKKYQKTEQFPEKDYSNSFSRPAMMTSASPSDIPLTPRNIQFLQQTIGNQSVSRLIQTKLKIGQPNDKYEQEADSITDRIMSMPEPRVLQQPDEEDEELVQQKPLSEQISPLIQRQEEPEEGEKIVQAKERHRVAQEFSPMVESGIQSIKGGGQPLPKSTRNGVKSTVDS